MLGFDVWFCLLLLYAALSLQFVCVCVCSACTVHMLCICYVCGANPQKGIGQ